ncbi:MAG: deoxyguanosinetriphosphate triphosphohydrolase [Pseudomonadota bacterium]
MIDLQAYACDHQNSRGRHHPEGAPGHRNEFQRDRDRIIHSSAFRRLEYKTQVFINHEGDLFRTRLTHTLEVAQIARTIARALGLHEDLTEAICLAHDLGHTPFGHAGQEALNRCMKPYGGFEHNLQSLRVVDFLEQKYADFDGLNLSFETREGILKHCSKRNAKALGELGQRFLQGRQPALEAQLANLADEVAYNNHDVDDGLRSGLITVEQLLEVDFFRERYETVRKKYPGLEWRRSKYEVVRRMITGHVSDIIENSQRLIAEQGIDSPEDARRYSGKLIAFSDTIDRQNRQLKHFLLRHLYRHYKVHRMTSKAQHVIERQFEAYLNDPRLLPGKHQRAVAIAEDRSGEDGRARAIADYIAGMTDRYAIAEYDRLFDPHRTA